MDLPTFNVGHNIERAATALGVAVADCLVVTGSRHAVREAIQVGLCVWAASVAATAENIWRINARQSSQISPH